MDKKTLIGILLFMAPMLMGFIGLSLAPDTCKCVLQWKSDPDGIDGKNYACRTNGCPTPCPDSPKIIGGGGTADDPLIFTCQCSDTDICNCKGYQHLWSVDSVWKSTVDCVGGCSDATKACKQQKIAAAFGDACKCS